MNYTEFLLAFGKVAWEFEITKQKRLRARKGKRSWCPITRINYEKCHLYVGPASVRLCSDTLRLDAVLMQEIIDTSDHRGSHFSARTRRDLEQLIVKAKQIRMKK